MRTTGLEPATFGSGSEGVMAFGARTGLGTRCGVNRIPEYHHARRTPPTTAAATLVLAGELDGILPPRFGRSVAAEIPTARFDVMAGEAHQPFQESPDEFNARVDAFWREADARG
jgi:pimeloyl-ACP methyl ester carboxylesterase